MLENILCPNTSKIKALPVNFHRAVSSTLQVRLNHNPSDFAEVTSCLCLAMSYLLIANVTLACTLTVSLLKYIWTCTCLFKLNIPLRMRCNHCIAIISGCPSYNLYIFKLIVREHPLGPLSFVCFRNFGFLWCSRSNKELSILISRVYCPQLDAGMLELRFLDLKTDVIFEYLNPSNAVNADGHNG